jgi:hypothetical protein
MRYTPVNGCLPTRISLATRQVQCYLRPCGNALSELLGKRDDDALRAADVTEPVPVLVLGDFAYELSAMGAQAREETAAVPRKWAFLYVNPGLLGLPLRLGMPPEITVLTLRAAGGTLRTGCE